MKSKTKPKGRKVDLWGLREWKGKEPKKITRRKR